MDSRSACFEFGKLRRLLQPASQRRGSGRLCVENLESRELLAVSVSSLTGTEGVPINTQVATFAPADVSGTSPQAMINWGDGHTTTGTVVMVSSTLDGVVGTNTYSSPGTYPITVTITSTGGTAAFGEGGKASIAPVPLSGQLDALSETGASGTDGITAINQPTFSGLAQPYAIVQLFARRTDQAQPVLLGQAVASVVGNWNLSVGALPDGVYSFTAAQVPTTGSPTTMVSLTPSFVVIDTMPPAVLSVSAQPSSAQVAVVFKDKLSGIDLSSAANRANYALVGPHGFRIHPSSVTVVPNAAVRPSDPAIISLQFGRSVKIHNGQRLAMGGITDLAGNPVPREYFPIAVASGGTAGAGHLSRRAARVHVGGRRL